MAPFFFFSINSLDKKSHTRLLLAEALHAGSTGHGECDGSVRRAGYGVNVEKLSASFTVANRWS